MWYLTEILTRLILGLSVLSGAIPLCLCEHGANADSLEQVQAASSCCRANVESTQSQTASRPGGGHGEDCPHCNGHPEFLSCQTGEAPSAVIGATLSYPTTFALPAERPFVMCDPVFDGQRFAPVPRRHTFPAPTLRAQHCLSLT